MSQSFIFPFIIVPVQIYCFNNSLASIKPHSNANLFRIRYSVLSSSMPSKIENRNGGLHALPRTSQEQKPEQSISNAIQFRLIWNF